MHGYRFPSRGSETVYCRGSLRSDICELIEKALLERTPNVDLCRTLSQEVSSICGIYTYVFTVLAWVLTLLPIFLSAITP